jgi:hypothetical protein
MTHELHAGLATLIELLRATNPISLVNLNGSNVKPQGAVFGGTPG